MKSKVFLLLMLPFALRAQGKKRIAVFTFEDKTTTNYYVADKPVGEGMSDMLITELVKAGQFAVIERQQLSSLVQEFDLAWSGMLDATTAVKIGKMAGVQYAVFGAVTEYGLNNERKGTNAFGLNISSSKQEARVGIDVRMVEISSGEIIAAENVIETALATKSNILAMGNNDFDQTLVGTAARQAIIKVVDLLNKQLSGNQEVGSKIKIILVKEDGEILINAGKNAGINAGQSLAVIVRGEELIDPDTGASLGFDEEEIGEIQVTDNNMSNGAVSKCKMLKGQKFVKGMMVRLK